MLSTLGSFLVVFLETDNTAELRDLVLGFLIGKVFSRVFKNWTNVYLYEWGIVNNRNNSRRLAPVTHLAASLCCPYRRGESKTKTHKQGNERRKTNTPYSIITPTLPLPSTISALCLAGLSTKHLLTSASLAFFSALRSPSPALPGMKALANSRAHAAASPRE